MGVTAKLDDLQLAFECVSGGEDFGNEAYWCRDSGEIHYFSEFGDNNEPLPDDIADEKRYVAIPSRRDLGLGKPVALEFAHKYMSDDAAEVEDIFRRRGAYARFKALLEHRGQLNEWFAFEEARVTEALRKWCSDNGIDIS